MPKPSSVARTPMLPNSKWRCPPELRLAPFEAETIPIYDPFDTRLGRIQRGTGAGFLQCLADPGASAEEVLSCILKDPRPHEQQESRAPYYADLVGQLGIPVEPIVEQAEVSPAPGLAIDVLAELAGRQNPVALRLLDKPDTNPALVVGMASYLRDFPEWTRSRLNLRVVTCLAEHLEESEDLSYDVEISVDFWHPWRAQIPLVEEAFVEAAALAAAEAALAPQPYSDPESLTTSQLLEGIEQQLSDELVSELERRVTEADRALLADAFLHRTVPAGIRAAARTLGGLGDLRLLAVAEDLFGLPDDLRATDAEGGAPLSAEQRSRRAAMLWYFSFLPAEESLPLARKWWGRGGYFRIAAGRVLAKHAEPEDRTWLEGEFRLMIERTNGLGSGENWVQEIDALAHIANPASADLLVLIGERVTHAWARTRALRALAKTLGSCKSIDEALWDCEADAREIACRLAQSGTAVAGRRLRYLADLELEDDGVRELAAQRARDLPASEQ